MSIIIRPQTPAPSAGSRSQASLTAMTAKMPRIDLDELSEIAALQTRVDTKYLISPEQLVAVLDQIGSHLRVLDIEGQRSFGYESVYFDTTALRTFRDHRQGRRLRFKVRTRLYQNSGDCMLEVKVKNARGKTVKRRVAYPAEERFTLNAEGRKFVAEVLHAEYGASVPDLIPALVGTYRRTTFVDVADHTRMTCDAELAWSNDVDRVSGPDSVLVETKSADGSSRVDRALRGLGIRPLRISKYCVGSALLHPHLPANPWNRVLRHEFGWERHSVPLPA